MCELWDFARLRKVTTGMGELLVEKRSGERAQWILKRFIRL